METYHQIQAADPLESGRTHGPQGSIMDAYTTPTWEALCGEVAKLRLSPPPTEEIAHCTESAQPAPERVTCACYGVVTVDPGPRRRLRSPRAWSLLS